MRVFFPQIVKALPSKSDTQDRRWIYVPYDRLTDRTGPLLDTKPAQCGIVMVESLEKGMRRPYHKKKLALLLSNERHFALEQAARGVKVIYVFTERKLWRRVVASAGKLLDQTDYADASRRERTSPGSGSGAASAV